MNEFTKGWKQAARKRAVSDGYYDGRFRPRVIKNPRHEQDKYACRQRVLEEDNSYEEEEEGKPLSPKEDKTSYALVQEEIRYYPFQGKFIL